MEEKEGLKRINSIQQLNMYLLSKLQDKNNDINTVNINSYLQWNSFLLVYYKHQTFDFMLLFHSKEQFVFSKDINT